MSFHNVIFPERLSYGTSGGASFSTAIKMSDSGVERRSAEWQANRHRMQYDVAKSVQNEEDLAEILDFFICMRGAACGFRFKDPNDWSTASDGTSYPASSDDAHVAGGWVPGTTSKVFTMRKQYANELSLGVDAFWRDITRPIEPGHADHRVLIYFNGQLVWQSVGSGPQTMAQGVKAMIDYDSGTVIFDAVPSGEVRIACTFHVPSRFGQDADDMLDVTWEAPGIFNINSIPIVEITGDPSTGEEEWRNGGHSVIDLDAQNAYPVIEQRTEETASSLFFYEVNVIGTGPPWVVSQFQLQQLNPGATAGLIPQTPMASGEWFTGGPMCLVSKTTGSLTMNVEQMSASGSPLLIDTLYSNNYVELYWFGNSHGYQIR